MVDKLPDTDQLTGELMDPTVFASRWQNDPRSVIWSLLKKHEGDLVKLTGVWKPGYGEIPDALFDAQYALNDADFHFCKSLDEEARMARSKYAADYAVLQGIKAKKGKGRRRR